jgi:hypothetical protein
MFGNDYVSAASQCWIGITCKAGWFDRLLAKYIEFGKGCCLPIGDVPSFMPATLRNEMIEVTEDHTAAEIVRMMEEALHDKHLAKSSLSA